MQLLQRSQGDPERRKLPELGSMEGRGREGVGGHDGGVWEGVGGSTQAC